MKNRRMFLAAIAAVGALMVCAVASAQTTTQTTTTQQTTTQTTNPVTGATQTQTTTTMVLPVANQLSVGDQIFLMNVIRANALEIELSKVAVRQAASKGVSDFALMMINDHTNLQNQLMATYGAQPWMTDWSNSLRRTNQYNTNIYGYYFNNGGSYTTTNTMYNGATTQTTTTTTTTTVPPVAGTVTVSPAPTFDNWMYLDASDWDRVHHLEGLQGFPFDKQYIQMMVMDHRKLMGQIYDAQNSVSNPDVAALVNTIGGTVQNHLEEARRISFNYDDPFGVTRAWPWIH